MESVYDVDTSGVDALRDLFEELEEAGITVAFARMRSRILDLMRAAELEERVGPDHFFLEVDDGVQAYLEREGDLRAGDGDDARSEGDPAGA